MGVLMLKISQNPLPRNALRMRAWQLSLVSSPIWGAYFYGQTSHSSPFFCLFRSFTGIPCPGCGMTRSFMAIARGDVAMAVSYHLFGPLVFASLCWVALHLMLELLTQRQFRISSLSRLLRDRRNQSWVLLALLAYHGLRLSVLARSGDLGINFYQSP